MSLQMVRNTWSWAGRVFVGPSHIIRCNAVRHQPVQPKMCSFQYDFRRDRVSGTIRARASRNSGKINRNCPDKIKCQILSRQIFVSSFASAWKISKLSNSVNFWSAWAHKSGQHSLPMDKNSDRQDSSEVVQWKYLNPRVSQKKRKDNYSPSSDNKTNPVQLHAFGSFCDKWLAS